MLLYCTVLLVSMMLKKISDVFTIQIMLLKLLLFLNFNFAPNLIIIFLHMLQKIIYHFLVDFSQMKSEFTRMNFDFTNLKLNFLRMNPFSFFWKWDSYSCNSISYLCKSISWLCNWVSYLCKSFSYLWNWVSYNWNWISVWWNNISYKWNRFQKHEFWDHTNAIEYQTN